MSLETEHRRHHTEPTPHPDEPQPIKWTGRRAAYWSGINRRYDSMFHKDTPNGRHRKPWGRRAAPWTLATAETDNESRNPWRAAA